jgi:Bacteriocin-protection, YdeI or OmpD-Associated/Domain of unknown function (DUF1905)
MRFRTVVQLEGKTATGLRVPSEVVDALGSGKRPRVLVTIGTHTYRSTVAAYRDVFMLPLSAENRAQARVAAGDQVDVDVVLDTAPREVDVPPDLAAALLADAVAGDAFRALSYSNQRRYTLAIDDAKTPETRARRVARTVDELRGAP